MGIVYMLSFGNLKPYVGSTTIRLEKRIAVHKTQCKYYTDGILKYNCSSFKIVKKEGFELQIIEEVVGETRAECGAREQRWTEILGRENLCNDRLAHGYDLERYKKSATKYRHAHKHVAAAYRDTHRETARAYAKVYYQQNRDKIDATNKLRRIKKLAIQKLTIPLVVGVGGVSPHQ